MILTEPLAIRIRNVEPLSPTLKHIVVEAADGGLLPTSASGAHLVLTLVGGDRTWRNAYSIVSPAGRRSHYEVIVRRTEQSRGGSAFVHEALAPGQVIRAAGPSNLFPLMQTARKHLLIGGGIGITPLLSHLSTLRDGGRRLELHQFAARDEVPLFEQLLAPFDGRDVHVHAGREALDIDALLARQPLGTHVYVCGPQMLMAAVAGAAARLGWPASKVHRESFGAAGGAPFTVRLVRSGKEIHVGEHETMLEAIEASGIVPRSLCRGGACGECLTSVIDGVPEHRDDFLSADEKAGGQLVMPCVSRAKTDTLVLDL